MQVSTEFGVPLHHGSSTSMGRADYVLRDRQGHPLAVIEAKKRAIHPYTAKQQALPYAKQLQTSFIFLTNGDLIYFWDYTKDDARVVSTFYSQRDLERLVYMRQEPLPLAAVPIPDYYLRYGERRTVRPYQQEARTAQRRILCAHVSLFFVTLMTSIMINLGS